MIYNCILFPFQSQSWGRNMSYLIVSHTVMVYNRYIGNVRSIKMQRHDIKNTEMLDEKANRNIVFQLFVPLKFT